MNKKLIVILLLAFLLVTPFLAKAAIAQQAGEQLSPIKTILTFVADNFGFLLTEQFRQELASGQGEGFLFVKIMLAMLIIFPLFMALKLLMGDKHAGIAGVVSVVVGLISIMFIPATSVITIAATYGTVATIFFYALPIGVVYFFYRLIHSTVEKKSKALAAFVELTGMIIGIGFTQQVTKALNELSKQNSMFATLIDRQWIMLLYAVFGVGALLAVYKLWKYGKENPESTLGRRIWGRGPSIGPGAGGEMASLRPELQLKGSEIIKIEEDIDRWNREFSDATQALRQSEAELNTLSGMQKALTSLSDAIDVLRSMDVSIAAYHAAFVPAEEKAAKLDQMQKNLEAKTAEVSGYWDSVSKGFSEISNEEFRKIDSLKQMEGKTGNIERLEYLRGDLTESVKMFDAMIKVNNEKLASLNPQSEKSEIESLGKANARFTKEISEINDIKAIINDNLNKTQSMFNDIRTAHKNIETFKNSMDSYSSEVESSLEALKKTGVTEDDFKKSSAYILSVAGKMTKAAEELKANKVHIDKITADEQEISAEFKSIEQRINTKIGELQELFPAQ